MGRARSWLESRHLGVSPAGAAALAGLESLPPEAAALLLAHCDQVAETSVSLAHSCFIAGYQASTESPATFQTWRSTFDAVLGPNAEGREAAAALATCNARRVSQVPPPVLDSWVQATTTLLNASRRLGTGFAEASAPLLNLQPIQIDAAAITAWSECALALLEGDSQHGPGGWRGELLAAAHVAAMARIAPRVGEDGVRAWSRLLVGLAAVGRSPKLPAAPEIPPTLPTGLVDFLLEVIAEAAARDPLGAAQLLAKLPAAAGALNEDEARTLCTTVRQTNGAGALEELADAAALVPGVVRGLDREQRLAAFKGLGELAQRFAPAVPAYLRSLDRAVEIGGLDGFGVWFQHGLEIAEANPKAAIAHFHLESRTAHKLLTQHSAAVAFEEVEPMLRRYLIMMSRRNFSLYPGPGVWLRPPLALPEEPGLRLPERVDLFPSSDDNQLFYKLTAAHIAGRWEYGTYRLDLSELARLGWTPPEPEQTSRNDVIGLIECFPNPMLASALFVLLEGARIDACLARDFAGLRPDLLRLGAHYAANSRTASMDRHSERLLAALFAMSVGALQAQQLPIALRAQGLRLLPALELLRAPEASVYDSAELLITLYSGLAFAEARADDEEGGVSPLGLEGGLGAALVDLYEDLGDGSPSPAARAQQEMGEQDCETTSRGDELLELSSPLELDEEGPSDSAATRPLSIEELRELLKNGGDLQISQEQGRIDEGLGLYIADLLGKLPAQALEELRQTLAGANTGDAASIQHWLAEQAASDHYLYDEWDHNIGDYRPRWCRLFEIEGQGDAGDYFGAVLARNDELVSKLKREFLMMRPEQFRKTPRMEDGEEFDLNAVVEAHADRRTRVTPSDRVYVARLREERDVATLFLIDMSASTDEPLPAELQPADLPNTGDNYAAKTEPRRVIDVTKDTLAVMAAVLEEIGDAYAIAGFSGHGRASVEYYHVKAFGERLGDPAKARLGGIAPKRSTRMGTALRHAAAQLAGVTAKARHLILLSDGFPQDFDYGDDRRSNVYGLRDTMKALQETEAQGIRTFCITVDPAGHDYLGEMCPTSRYAVIHNISDLPEELPRIYRQITRG